MTGTMSLNGTFDAPDLPEVLGLLTRRGCTGRLQLRAGARHVIVRLVDGNAVAIEGAGAAWSEGGSDIRAGLEEAFFEALRAGRGSFEFQSEQPSGESESGRTVRLATVVAAAQQRLEEWREVAAVIPSLDAVPRLSEDLKGKEITLTQEQWRIVVSVDGRRTVGGIARRLGRKPIALGKVLKPLVEGGAVRFDRSEAIAPRELPVVGLTRGSAEPVPSPPDGAEPPALDGAAGTADGRGSRRRGRGAGFRVLARE